MGLPKYSSNWDDVKLASAFIPVLAIEEGADTISGTMVPMRSRVVRSVASVDRGAFDARQVSVRLRIDQAFERVHALLSSLRRRGLIDEVTRKQRADGYLFVELRTSKFVELTEALNRAVPGLAVLLSLDGRTLYI